LKEGLEGYLGGVLHREGDNIIEMGSAVPCFQEIIATVTHQLNQTSLWILLIF
jgi:hypothetical protein